MKGYLEFSMESKVGGGEGGGECVRKFQSFNCAPVSTNGMCTNNSIL